MRLLKLRNQLIEEYEANANLKLALICRLSILFLVVIMILNLAGVFKIDKIIYPVLLFSMCILALPTVFYNVYHCKGLFVRYLVLTLIVLMSGVLYAFLSYHAIIMLVFPIVVSCLYCDRKSVWYTALIGLPVMLVSHLLALQLKVVPDEPLVTLQGTLFYGVLPRMVEYTAIAVVCTSMTGKIQELIRSLIQKNEQLLSEQEGIITSLSQMIESQSKETGMHVKRVSEYTKILCRGLGYEEEVVWKVGLASMMHDVGKILIPHHILEKPGRLTEEEYDIIKKHTLYGKRMLENSEGELMQLSSKIAYEHHERFDGKGYANIQGEDIDITSRCVSIADVFDALVSWRPYKEAWTPEEARLEIISQSGKQFDPDLIDIFDQHFEEFLEVLEQYPDSKEAVDTEAIFKE